MTAQCLLLCISEQDRYILVTLFFQLYTHSCRGKKPITECRCSGIRHTYRLYYSKFLLILVKFDKVFVLVIILHYRKVTTRSSHLWLSTPRFKFKLKPEQSEAVLDANQVHGLEKMAMPYLPAIILPTGRADKVCGKMWSQAYQISTLEAYASFMWILLIAWHMM